MNKNLLLSILVVCFSFVSMQAQDKANFANKQDSISYAIGIDIGKNLGSTNVPLNFDALYKGMKDFMNDSQAEIDEATCKNLIQEFTMQAQQAQMSQMQEQAQAALAKGNAWLADNKTKEGIQETESGLQYKVIRPGSGAKPTMQNTVKVHYEGTLLDGTKFDSSYDRGEPIEFTLGQVIRGWQEGLQLMSPGAKYELYIPSSIGYGERGSPPAIGPNETLIFVVELLEFK